MKIGINLEHKNAVLLMRPKAVDSIKILMDCGQARREPSRNLQVHGVSNVVLSGVVSSEGRERIVEVCIVGRPRQRCQFDFDENSGHSSTS